MLCGHRVHRARRHQGGGLPHPYPFLVLTLTLTLTLTLPLTQVGYKVFLGRRKYFVSVDVGGGRIQWYP